MPKCPKCSKRVLRIVDQPSTRLYVHDEGAKPAQLYGCAVSRVRRIGECQRMQ